MDALVPTPQTPPDEPERNLWDRQPGETGRQFEVFQQYLGLGPRRSCNTLAKDIGISRQLVYRWSGRNNWVLRAQAYERFLEQDAVNEAIVRRRRLREATFAITDTIRSKALEGFKILQTVIDNGGGPELNVKPDVLLRMFEIANREERAMLGRMDRAEVNRIEIIIKDASELEQRRLDELRQQRLLEGK